MANNIILPAEIKRVKFGMTFWLKRWYSSPLAYVIEHIGDIPTHQQAEVLKAFEHHNFVAVRSGHGIGKSKLMGWLGNWWLDTRCKRAPITGAGGDQLSDIVWPEIIETNRRKWPWIAGRYEATSEELRCKEKPEGWKAVLRTARMDNDDALQGFHDCMFFIDEASGVRDGIFEVASGAMGDKGSRGFMTGNPTKLTGYMYRTFNSAHTFWYCLNFSSEDSLVEEEYSYTYVDPLGEIRIIRTKGRQTRQWVEDMRDDYGLNSNAYRVRVKGEFASMGQDNLVDARYLERVFEMPENEANKEYKIRMGVDPAWTGDDDTGIVIRRGMEICHAESWHGSDTVESTEKIKVLASEWNVDFIHVDAIGVGAGIYDNLKHSIWRGQMGYPVIKVMVSESAPEDKDAVCGKMRDWLWWKSRKFFRTKAVRFAGRRTDAGFKQLHDEIIAPIYKIQNGKIIAESKDDLKKRGMKSPNVADALNLTFCQDYETFKETYIKSSEIADRWGKKKKKKVEVSWKGR